MCEAFGLFSMVVMISVEKWSINIQRPRVEKKSPTEIKFTSTIRYIVYSSWSFRHLHTRPQMYHQSKYHWQSQTVHIVETITVKQWTAFHLDFPFHFFFFSFVSYPFVLLKFHNNSMKNWTWLNLPHKHSKLSKHLSVRFCNDRLDSKHWIIQCD